MFFLNTFCQKYVTEPIEDRYDVPLSAPIFFSVMLRGWNKYLTLLHLWINLAFMSTESKDTAVYDVHIFESTYCCYFHRNQNLKGLRIALEAVMIQETSKNLDIVATW